MKHAKGEPNGEHRGTVSREIRLRFPGLLEEVPKARHELARWLEHHGATERMLDEFALVLTEICNNAIEHGSASMQLPIDLHGRVRDEMFELDVVESDGSIAGDLSDALSDSTAPPDAADERGRGLFLIQAYVDEIRVESTPQGRLRIFLKKKLKV